jgi:hypothetical protein
MNYNLSPGRWLAVWGFSDGREVGLIGDFDTRAEADVAVRDFWSRNPSCGAWVRRVEEE